MPRTTTRSASRPAADTRRPARDEDDERSTTTEEQGVSTAIGRGREGLRKHRETHQAGDFPTKDDRFKVKEDERVLIRFLDDDFPITYYEHQFFEEFEGEKRQKTFICLGDDCPLCAVMGEKHAKFFALINVLVVGRNPAVKLWFATPNPGSLIEDQMIELDEMPTPKLITDPQFYFTVSKSKGKNGFFEYKLSRIRARDLEEERGVTPLSESEIASYAAEKWDPNDFIRVTPRSKLLEIAEELDRLQEGE